MLGGSRITGSSQVFERGLPTRKISSHPVQIEGFQDTVRGREAFLKTSYTQQTPPAGLGYLPAEDRLFALTNNDYGADIVGKNLPSGQWRPLYHEKWLQDKSVNQQYNWHFLSPNGYIEDVMIQRTNQTRAPFANAYTLPTEKPVPMVALIPSRKELLKRGLE